MKQERANYDDIAWDLNDEELETAKLQFVSSSFCKQVVSAVSKRFGEAAAELVEIRLGGYNILYRVRVDGSRSDILVRIPCPSSSQFPEEKTLHEATTGLLLREATHLPVPEMLQYETISEIGPFIMLPYIENEGDMSDLLSRRRDNTNEVPVLDTDIDENLLEKMYSKLALCLLQLWQPEFNRIGSPENNNTQCLVLGRPITQNMSNMVQLANIPRDVLPSPNTTYKSADEWYTTLARMHIAQLTFQHNDLVESADDCKNKYISRYLFHKLAKEGKFSTFGFADDNWSAKAATVKSSCSAPDMEGRFRLWCDDLRPDSFLVNECKNIVAAIDWEFTYAAPTQFILDPPWWLLLHIPEMWPAGIEDWAMHYEQRLHTWLSSIKTAESSTHPNTVQFNLSEYMRDSWVMGRFWLNYAARKSWAFDAIYWKYLDVRFFGERQHMAAGGSLWMARIGMLNDKEKLAMDAFVEKKMSDTKVRKLFTWTPGDARKRMAEVLMED